jgi:hypothetical protein
MIDRPRDRDLGRSELEDLVTRLARRAAQTLKPARTAAG